jgi:hypothetical protein
MAIVKNNPIIKGLSGMVGKSIVFKQLRGKTIICNRPPKPQTQSAPQKETRDRFRKASEWAKSILLDADQKAYYQKKAHKLKLPNAYTAAIADYMRSAKVMQKNQYADKTTFFVYKKDFDVVQVNIVVSKDSGEKETRTLPRGESHFWIHSSELHAGALVMITDAAGVTQQHLLSAA